MTVSGNSSDSLCHNTQCQDMHTVHTMSHVACQQPARQWPILTMYSLCQSLTMSDTQNNKFWLALLAMVHHCYDKRRCRPLYFIGSTSGNERPLKVVSNFPIPSPIPAFQWYKEIILTAFQRRNKPYYCFVRNNKIPFVAGNFAEWRTAFYANGLFCCNW